MWVFLVLAVALAALWAVPFAFNRARGAPRPDLFPIIIASVIVIGVGVMLLQYAFSTA